LPNQVFQAALKTYEEIMVARALFGVPVRRYIVMYSSGSFCVARQILTTTGLGEARPETG